MRPWNRCDDCGRFVAYANVYRRLVTPDSHRSREEYETLCRWCKEKEDG